MRLQSDYSGHLPVSATAEGVSLSLDAAGTSGRFGNIALHCDILLAQLSPSAAQAQGSVTGEGAGSDRSILL